MRQQQNPLKNVPQKTFLRRKLFFQTVLIIAIVGFAILTYLAKLNPYFGFDLTITKSLQSIHLIWFYQLMRFLSLLGNTPIAILSVVVAIVLSVSLGRKKNALFLGISTTGITIISLLIKFYVNRPRPDISLISLIGNQESTPSFPSGHVLFFIGFYGLLLFFAYSQLIDSLFRKVIIACLSLLIIFIGVSRIYIGVHWFSDVLGSYLIGTVWLYSMIYLYKKIG